MFARAVEIDGVLYREHTAIRLEHEAGKSTWVRTRSKSGHKTIDTQHELPLQVGITFEQAEMQVSTLPFFAEKEDPLSSLVDEIASMLDDENAASVPQAFREWEPGAAYQVGDRRRYMEVLYKCLQAHISLDGQTPDVAVSLWARILNPDPDTPLPWVQPDSTNPYMTGDRVTHNGHVWESDVDNNVWEPGVYGWTQID